MGWYRIKAVSRITGIRPELLRVWERRYHLFKPQRAGNRYRAYDDEDIQLLLYLRQQMDQGRSIGELAAEGRVALLQQLTASLSPPTPAPESVSSRLDELLDSIRQLDKGGLEARLAELAAFNSFATLLTTLLTPLMHRVGELWALGDVPAVCGHFATVILKQRLLAMLHATAPAAEAPVLLCACPAGEFHELGLLTCAYTMQQEGWQIYYLGPNLPLDTLLQGCQRLQPALVALSLTHTTAPSDCLDILHEIDTQLAATYPTFVGGQAVERFRHLFNPSYLYPFDTLSAAQRHGRALYPGAL